VGDSRTKEALRKHPVRCVISVLGALLVVSVFGVGFASATSLEETAAVTSVTETASSALPDPVPSATPTAPAAPRLPVKEPIAAAPSSSPSSDNSVTDVSSPRGGLPSVDGTVRDTTGVAGRDMSTSREAAQQVSTSARGGSGGDSNLRGASQGGDPTTSEENRSSIDSAEVAPRRWFFIHVWPAIALGWARLTTPLEGLGGTTSLRPTDAARLLPGFSGVSRPRGDRTPSAARSAKPKGLLAVPTSIATAAESLRTLIFLALVVLMGSFVVWTESRSPSRPR
jgi:hypothetical protein